MESDWLYQSLIWMYARGKLGKPDVKGELKISINDILKERRLSSVNTTYRDVQKLIDSSHTKYVRLKPELNQTPHIHITRPPPSLYTENITVVRQHPETTTLSKWVCCSWNYYLGMIRKDGLQCFPGKMIRCCSPEEADKCFPEAEVLLYCQDHVTPFKTVNGFVLTQNVPAKCITHIDQKRPHIEILRRYGFVVFNTDLSRVLLVKSRRGNWGFPKGKRELGETPIQCASRELTEETGLDYSILDTLENDPHHVVEMESLDDPVPSVGLFVAKLKSGHEILQPQPQVEDEIQDCQWIPVQEAVTYLSSHRKPLLEYIIRYILK